MKFLEHCIVPIKYTLTFKLECISMAKDFRISSETYIVGEISYDIYIWACYFFCRKKRKKKSLLTQMDWIIGS